MAFKRIKGADRGSIKYNISSLALAVEDIVVFSVGNNKVVKATSTAEIDLMAGIVMAATTTSDTTVLCQRISEGDEYLADCANDSDADDNYDRMVLTDHDTVNNSGSDVAGDTGVFRQLRPYGAASDKKCVGYFITGSHGD